MKKYSIEWWHLLPPEKVGKETEKIVEEVLKEWNSRLFFAYLRMPDARAARGHLAAQPGDFLYQCCESSGFIEIKALKHPCRLPASRLTQLPVLRKWDMAGARSIILVHHYMIGKWRVLYPAVLETNVTSWDISEVRTYESAADALESTNYFSVK